MLYEYLEGGKAVGDIHPAMQERLFLDIAKFIAKVNAIPVDPRKFAFQRPLTTYRIHVATWQERLKEVRSCEEVREWVPRIQDVLPRAIAMLDTSEERLARVLERVGPSFIFESAHIGHCWRFGEGFRFLNWEKVSFGDPSYTLAVLLASIFGRSGFEDTKRMMIKTYLEERYIPEFAELVDQRMAEREVSNFVWTLWSYARMPAYIRPRGFDPLERYSRVDQLLLPWR